MAIYKVSHFGWKKNRSTGLDIFRSYTSYIGTHRIRESIFKRIQNLTTYHGWTNIRTELTQLTTV